MIQNLLQHILTLLREGFVGLIAAPENQIVAGPLAEPVETWPTIAVYPAAFELGQKLKETVSSQPRPQEFRQEIAVDKTKPHGPYSLAKTPLLQSTRCKLIFDRGALTERQVMLLENKDFTLNYQNASLSFNADPSKAGVILLTYSFAGVFTVQEFQQEFLIDIYEDDPGEVEKLASLATAMILTSHDELVEQYNFTAKTEYVANQFITTHTINRIQALTGTPGRLEAVFKLQLKYNVTGQMKLTREITDGFGLIEKIHSPARISEHPVDIEIELG